MPQPNWMAHAWQAHGVRELKGSRHNHTIVSYFRDVGHAWVGDDETAWCAAFVGSCLERAGLTSTRSLRARSYLEWGRKIEQPAPGCVVVLSRGPNPQFGHVGFYYGETKSQVLLLGGNQSDAVNVGSYDKRRVLGYRWPADAPATDQGDGQRFESALTHVLEMEGGWSNDPVDPGGATNKGITIGVYSAHRGERLGAHNRSRLIQELRAISDSTVKTIYRERYWHPSKAAWLPPALGFMHFDASVNHGVTGAARMLQEAVRADIDGEIGPLTLSAAHREPEGEALERYAAIRRRKYRGLQHFWRFGRGWLRRVEATLGAAKHSLQHRTPHASQPSRTEDAIDMTENTKWWGQSMTIWGALMTALSTVVPLIAPIFGLEVSGEMVEQIGEQVLRLAQLAGGLIGTVMTILGRTRATAVLQQRRFNLTI